MGHESSHISKKMIASHPYREPRPLTDGEIVRKAGEILALEDDYYVCRFPPDPREAVSVTIRVNMVAKNLMEIGDRMIEEESSNVA